MSTNLYVVVVAAVLLTGLAATPADAAFRFRFQIPARGWLRRYLPPPAPTPTTPTPAPAAHCTCPPSASASTTADVPAPDPDPQDCVTPVAGMGVCFGFLTGSSSGDAPAPGSDCCVALSAFVDMATTAGGGINSQLKCLCPVIRGDANPFDPLRMLYLPTACVVAVPPLIPLCLNATSRFVTTPTP